MSEHRWYKPGAHLRMCVRCGRWSTRGEDAGECEYLDAYVVDAWVAHIEKHDAGHVWTSAQVVDLLRAISHGVEPKEAT